MREDDLDDEMRRLSRTTLIRVFKFISRERLAAFRDTCWWLADSIDELLQKNSNSGRMVRPTGKMVSGFENGLRKFVGHDAEKASALKFFVDTILTDMEGTPVSSLPLGSARVRPASPEQRREFRRAVQVLMRGFPGRPADADKQEIYRQAMELHETNGLSYARIARKLLPEEYRINPHNATATIKAGIKRLRNKESGNKNTPPLSS